MKCVYNDVLSWDENTHITEQIIEIYSYERNEEIEKTLDELMMVIKEVWENIKGTIKEILINVFEKLNKTNDDIYEQKKRFHTFIQQPVMKHQVLNRKPLQLNVRSNL